MTGTVDLSELDEGAGALFQSISLTWRGAVVTGIGDINGDGFDDFAIGLPSTQPAAQLRPGEVHIIFGSPSISTDDINLANLRGEGFVLRGAGSRLELGGSIASGGDINGDGLDDLVVSGNINGGMAFVVFGSTDAYPSSFSIRDLDGTNGFAISLDSPNGTSNANTVVEIVGDLNGDGFDDIFIANSGSSRFDDDFVGIVFGSDEAFPSSINFEDLESSQAIRIIGTNDLGRLGTAVTSGDINGDGIDDIIISAPAAVPDGSPEPSSPGRGPGEIYVVYGTEAGFDGDFDLASLDGGNGFVIQGDQTQNGLGANIDFVGDINGDGIGDLLISTGDRGDGGSIYVMFGSDDGFAPVVDLTALDGTNGFTILPVGNSDRDPRAVSAAGDVNGDGLNDLLIATSFTLSGPRVEVEAFILYGRADGFSAEVDPAQLDGTNGVLLGVSDIFDEAGRDLSLAGDVNGDGFDDILLTGGDTSFDDIHLFLLFGGEGLGIPINARGAEGADSLLGGPSTDTLIGGAGNDTLDGGSQKDLLIGDAGADRLLGGGGDDTLRAGANDDGDDTLIGGFGDDTINGGPGADRLIGDSGNDTLTGDAGDDDLFGGGGDDLIRGGDGNDSLYGSFDHDTLFGGNGEDTVDGGNGDDWIDGGTGADVLRGGEGNDTVSFASAVEGISADFTDQGSLGEDTLSGFEAVSGTDFDDTLSGLARLSGGRGNDMLLGGNCSDTLVGDRGLDTLMGGDGDDFLIGGAQPDVLFGGEGRDNLRGGNGADIISGGVGKDTLDGSVGNDSLSGGGSGDRLFGDDGADTLNGGGGSDRVDYLKGDEAILVDLETGEAAGGFAEGDVLISIESVFGGAGNDTLRAWEAGNRLGGAGGDDLVVGRGGNDRLGGGNGNDLVIGGGGNDLINGNRGDDTLIGGAGDDTLRGGNGPDTFVFAAGSGQDVVADFRFIDSLDLSETTTDFTSFADVLSATTETDDGLLIDLGGGDSVLLANVRLESLAENDLIL